MHSPASIAWKAITWCSTAPTARPIGWRRRPSRNWGAEVTTLFDDPNGKNINVNCGSQHPETLAAEVLKQRADVGFAFDGDGDRLIAVDEKGNVLTGDQIIAVCADVMKKEGTLTNNLVVRTVMSNIGLSVAFEKTRD